MPGHSVPGGTRATAHRPKDGESPSIAHRTYCVLPVPNSLPPLIQHILTVFYLHYEEKYLRFSSSVVHF